MEHVEIGQFSEPEQDELLQDQRALPKSKAWVRLPVTGVLVAGVLAVVLCMAFLGGTATAAPPVAPPAVVAKLIQLHEKAVQASASGGAPSPLQSMPSVCEDCKAAFVKHIQGLQQSIQKLMMEAMTACFKDPKGEECNSFEQKVDGVEKKMMQECKSSGSLCTVTMTDKEGEHEEEQCIPKECHEDHDMDAMKEQMEKVANMAEKEDPGCKDFDCTVDIKCQA